MIHMPLLKRPCTYQDEEAGLMRRVICYFKVFAMPVAVTIICISVGMMHPIATEAAKSAQLQVCERHDGVDQCRLQAGTLRADGTSAKWVMPFHAATLTIVAELAAVALSFGVSAAGAGSATAAARRVLEPRVLLQLLPVGIIYGLGDFMQTIACNAASAPIVLVVGQSKLLLAAILSKFLIRSEQKTNWFRLVIISCAAMAATDIGAGSLATERRSELYGAALALAKATLSSGGAVLTEKYFKTGCADFWVVSTQVQLMMLSASLALLPWTASSWWDMLVTEFFHGGPYPLCSECTEILSEGEACNCIEHRGWDHMTVLAVAAIVVNGLSTGLTLRYLSAVTKSVCNALSAGIFYILYVALGFRPFNMAQANIMAIVCMSSYEYAMEKIQYANKRRRDSSWVSGHP